MCPMKRVNIKDGWYKGIAATVAAARLERLARGRPQWGPRKPLGGTGKAPTEAGAFCETISGRSPFDWLNTIIHSVLIKIIV